ncbi:ArsR/SmtB family transcription factor [Terrabacter sp. C0L_2]|uniref:ArsR/SmtB family transcription factor n=1 Tax=Terrabacter sp. C0L_2 TaxID=3108389 RepID=UPI0017A424DA|nr:helix-turn-helix transcriptional regulator [Dermatophilaceae bacterium]WVM95457.1 metalloregulator ArsR/SmtB family transcription factor [Terrabacter sp. C0L_2]
MPAQTAAREVERLGLPPGSPLVPAEHAGRRVMAKFFRAIGDPTRLLLLEFLLDGERTVSECIEQVGLSQSRVSSHLACLADCGFVTARRDGRFTRYQVTDPRVVHLISLARALTADNAAALAACVRIDT